MQNFSNNVSGNFGKNKLVYVLMTYHFGLSFYIHEIVRKKFQENSTVLIGFLGFKW